MSYREYYGTNARLGMHVILASVSHANRLGILL
jgi:hypothetical protein